MYLDRLQDLHSPKARLATSAGALAFFVIVFTLALLAEHPRPGILHFHAVPIAVLALQLGILVGLSAVAASLSLMFVWAEIEGVELLMVDYLSGAVPFLVVLFLCQLVATRIVGHQGAPQKQGSRFERNGRNDAPELTDRERDVLGLLALGHTNREAAEELFLSVRTVESHRARIQQKLGITGRAELVRYAIDRDLVAKLPITPGDRDLKQVQ
jgi:DNA-binding CsgD family transcriptional regulator